MSDAVFRIDKFAVPQASLGEFMQRVRQTHALLARQPGFVRDLVVEQVGGPGQFNVVTLVEWQDQASIERARDAMHAFHLAQAFDPAAFWQQLGITADLGNYRLAFV